MPELVPEGPRIPVHLMNEVDEGSVVFFCGAGVSVVDGSNLPNFDELVEHVYEANRIEADEVEHEALHRDEPDRSRRRPQFDKALGLLERSDRLGPEALRGTVIERLSKPATAPLRVHEALLTLSRTEGGTRLVTTNFDNRFVEAGEANLSVDAAPKLPVPTRYNWSSLVHLHGRIVPDEGGANLVLTAADFGRAYLTERWAARFVTELFREFTVVFVGYSVADPVMSYLVDALAAERDKGARFANAYAFAPHNGTPEGKNRARDSWHAKNVRPVLYDDREGHRLLSETLIAWVRIRSDPFHARPQIALNDIGILPAGPNDPVVERVVWALEDPVAAAALAEAPPTVDEGDFPKIERWLDAFQEAGLLSCDAADANPGAGAEGPAFVRLVDSGYQSQNPNTLDTTRRCLAYWIARHLHVPQVLAWMLKNGGRMHPALRDMVEANLSDAKSPIPPRLRLLWTILSNYEPRNLRGVLWSSKHYLAAASDPERRRVEDEVIADLAPELIVVPGPTTHVQFARYFDGNTEPIAPIDACGHPKLVVGGENTEFYVERILRKEGVLARHAERLTTHLEQALALAEEDDAIYSDSSLYRASIKAHDQNRHRETGGLGHLIDLVGDAYLEVAAIDRARAENLLRRWVLSRKPLFTRLALHALTEDPKSDINLARTLLLTRRPRGVWNWELQREVLRLFRKAGARLPRDLRVEIVRAIHEGPKPKPRNPPPNYPALIRREQALRLHKLSVSGARLDKKSRELAEGLEVERDADAERDEFLRWRGEARWIGDEEFAPQDLLEGTVADVARAIRDESASQDQFRGLARAQPEKAIEALEELAAEGTWRADFWKWFLWSVPNSPEGEEADIRLHERAARCLVNAPDWLFDEVEDAVAELVKELARTYGTDREGEIAELWEKGWNAVRRRAPSQIVALDEPLTDALNDAAGKLADAALARLSKYRPRVGNRLPEPVRGYFNAITEEPSGHLGRVMIATRLHYLYAVDQDWVSERLIPRFRPGESEEANNLWYAYGWSRTIGPDLLLALKQAFIDLFRAGNLNARTERNLTLLFMTICLEAPGELTGEEVHVVVGVMSEAALTTVLASLQERLKGEAAERAEVWREKVGRWLRAYWPARADRNTPGTATAMVDLLAECGDAFPDATDWALDYLQPIDTNLFRLRESGQATSRPGPTLEILSRVIGPEGIAPQYRYTLREILDEMGEADDEMQGNVRFQRLYRQAAE